MVESLERVAGGRVAGLGRLAGKGGREVTKEQPLAGKAGRGQELLLQQQLALKIRKRAPSQALFPRASNTDGRRATFRSQLRARWMNALRDNLPRTKNINYHQNDRHGW